MTASTGDDSPSDTTPTTTTEEDLPLPGYLPGSAASFVGIQMGLGCLLSASNGDKFFALLVESFDTTGGHMSSAQGPVAMSFTVQRSFAKGFLVLGAAGKTWFATLVATAPSAQQEAPSAQ